MVDGVGEEECEYQTSTRTHLLVEGVERADVDHLHLRVCTQLRIGPEGPGDAVQRCKVRCLLVGGLAWVIHLCECICACVCVCVRLINPGQWW